MRSTTLRSPRDSPRVGASGPAGVGRPVDLIQTANTWLFRAYRDGAGVYVEKSKDAGANWAGAQVASDAEATGIGSCPTLMATPWDDVLLAYHQTGGGGVLLHSADYGASWTIRATLPGKQPRVAFSDGILVLAAYVGGGIRIYTSTDYGATLETHGLLPSDEGRISLVQNRHGPLMLGHLAGGQPSVRHSYDNGRSWSDPVSLLPMRFPAYHLGLERAFTGGYDPSGNTPVTVRTGDDGENSQAVAAVPTGSWKAHYPGVLWSHREHVYWIGDAPGGFVTRASYDAGRSWLAP